jgi:hypothetical protein
MTTGSIKALALGFYALALSTLPALAEDCKWTCGALIADCAARFGPEYSARRAETTSPTNFLKDCRATATLCCRVPVTKTAPVGGGHEERVECGKQGREYDPATHSCIRTDRPVKNIGKAKTGEGASTGETPAMLKPVRDCKAKGWRWNESTGTCIKPSEAKADCESRGHQYDIDTGRCIKSLKPTEQSEADDDDHKPKNKKKKKQYDDDRY